MKTGMTKPLRRGDTLVRTQPDDVIVAGRPDRKGVPAKIDGRKRRANKKAKEAAK